MIAMYGHLSEHPQSMDAIGAAMPVAYLKRHFPLGHGLLLQGHHTVENHCANTWCDWPMCNCWMGPGWSISPATTGQEKPLRSISNGW